MIVRLYITPPFQFQSGDRFYANGFAAEQERAGVVIQTRTFSRRLSRERVELTELVGSNSIDRIYLEVSMPGQVVTMVDASRGANGVVRFNFSNGTQREFADDAAALEDTKYIDTEPKVLEDALILKTYRNSPDGANLENMVGGSVSSDFTASIPIVLTEPE